MGMDVRILCQSDVSSEGIFDRDWNTYAVTELPSVEEDSEQLEAFYAHIAEWASAIRTQD